MKNTRYDKALTDIRSVRMGTQEKAALKARVLGVSPATFEAPVKSPFMPLVALPPYYRWTSWVTDHRRFSAVFAAALVVVLGGGGMVSAAAGSLPGDVLYPVKVAFVEPIRGSLSMSAESKAEWQASRVEARLSEAEKLAAEDRLDEERHAELNRLLNRHGIAFDKAVKEMALDESSEQVATVTAKLDTSLEVHAGGSFASTASRKGATSTVKIETAALMIAPASAPIVPDTEGKPSDARDSVSARSQVATEVEALPPAIPSFDIYERLRSTEPKDVIAPPAPTTPAALEVEAAVGAAIEAAIGKKDEKKKPLAPSLTP